MNNQDDRSAPLPLTLRGDLPGRAFLPGEVPVAPRLNVGSSGGGGGCKGALGSGLEKQAVGRESGRHDDQDQGVKDKGSLAKAIVEALPR
jgi:hypothetical protein